ncbi:hypothetical protein E1091_10495 [Micromonospora fluostatini]|uniref:Uncharacterized protein n=1 Tax=Micromonospora fluostatini TaxID=1629071 RepID=A0ABY2DGN2_9ACTN|nr:hypothetical protein E1091_10495 [Micromonospora fluostatini]
MTHTVELLALDGRDPLGFLASLGVTRLLHDEANLDVELSYDETSARALLHGPLTTVDAVVDALVEVVDAIAADGVLPRVPATFPLPRVGATPDPMRMPRDQVSSRVHAMTNRHRAPALNNWLAVLVTDLASDIQGRAALTPYTAPAGRQSLRSFFNKPLDEVRKAPALLIRQALTRWRRVNGCTGEYLDHRVLSSAADHPSGHSTDAGVPGATWLATMSLPLLRLTGTGKLPQATLWHHLAGHRQPVMSWPLWRQPLNLHAIATLLEHPDLRPHTNSRNDILIDPAAWPALGVFTAAAAVRQPAEGRRSKGILTPIAIVAASRRPGSPAGRYSGR